MRSQIWAVHVQLILQFNYSACKYLLYFIICLIYCSIKNFPLFGLKGALSWPILADWIYGFLMVFTISYCANVEFWGDRIQYGIWFQSILSNIDSWTSKLTFLLLLNSLTNSHIFNSLTIFCWLLLLFQFINSPHLRWHERTSFLMDLKLSIILLSINCFMFFPENCGHWLYFFFLAGHSCNCGCLFGEGGVIDDWSYSFLENAIQIFFSLLHYSNLLL